MAALIPLAVAALGLLVERPMHPYEMYQLLVEREEDRLLKVRPGSLYHAVDRLAGSGLVEPLATERSGNRPERTRFRITDDGRRVLTERLTEMLAHPAAEYPEFPLAISEAHNLPLEEVLACIRTRVKRLAADRGRFASRASDVEARAVPRRFWIDVGYQQAMREAEIAWLNHLDQELTTGALSWDEKQKKPEQPLSTAPGRARRVAYPDLPPGRAFASVGAGDEDGSEAIRSAVDPGR